ncbi:MAG: hypothetical protein PHO80_03360 [Candidatus Gracilibacteria bacterium]|nr:hypothetical protein [Candidatus Gracilibacteria bacterium]MDD4530560.1 hypothetical protein [Candidatus Gracilibacteria bacterium]
MISDNKKIDSLCKFYFDGINLKNKKTEHYIEVASNRAYRDLCRTLSGISKSSNSLTLRNEVNALFCDYFNNLNIINAQKEFDENFHEKICKEIIEIYKDFKVVDHRGQEVVFTYGHAQKWVNMTLKYLFILSQYYINKEIDNIYRFCHMPIDSIIIKELCDKKIIKNFNIKKVWSKLNKERYDYIIGEIKKHIKEKKYKSMLDFEMEIWKS